MDDFIRQSLTISVAQICENIGWHSISDSSMKIITDILHHYISDLSITSKKYAEHAYGVVPVIEDVEKAFHQKSISLTALRRYLKHTGPVKFPHSLPMLNIPGKSTFNAIKPGSREIVTRPIHFHEHLPTLHTEPNEEELTTEVEKMQKSVEIIKEEPKEVIIHKRLREISSVVMTSGGFLSPSREGRLAESKLMPFPEIKNDAPLEIPKLSDISPIIKEKSSLKSLTIKKKIKSKKLKTGSKKKSKNSKNQLLQPNEQKPEVLKKNKKNKDVKVIIPKEPIINVPDVVNVTEEVKSPEKVKGSEKDISSTPRSNKPKMEEVLPKFSFFGPLPQGPGLIPSTFPQITINKPDKIEKSASPVLAVENDDISRKEQKKKKKDKKKEKKEKKKQKEKEKEKKKDKHKSVINKVPKIKLKLGTRLETISTTSPVIKPPEENISIVSEPEPMEIDVVNESKSDVSIDILHDNSSPPKVPISKIKTKIETKIVQPVSSPPVKETPPAFYFDEAGNQVWICPLCTKPDDGSPMIGCDGCDVWYHWVCVGIQCPPDCAVWYCPRCLAKRAQPKGKRGRPRKNKL